MPEYICSSCGSLFEAESNAQGKIICVSCGAVLSAEDTQQALSAGTRIAGYEIIRHIASGGSGNVYLAEQIAMERTVALKILNPERMDKDSAERFLEEARNTAKFENPHVVPVIDTGISPEGFYYIAMQYVEGETLEEILLRGRVFSEEETLIISLAVADALQAVWNKCGMFHKDIKPGNIMLTPENEVMILDFGTAQEHGESRLADGDIEGSPYYMSPEQARGETLTWSTDLYSLGATMYQMLTGKYLYDGGDVEEILRQHDSAPFPDPSVRAPEMHVSEKMTALLRQMLEKTPARRCSSWEEFIRNARRLLDTVWERKGAAFPDSLRKQYMALRKSGSKPVLKLRSRPSSLKIVLSGLLIFIFGGALLGGFFLYLAARKNSVNARILLEPVRQQASSLEMDPDMVEEMILKAAPYFRRIGVLPSIRNEFEICRLKVKDFRELSRKEEIRINRLETLTAERLQAADLEERKAGEAALKSPPQAALTHFKRSISILQHTFDTVKDTPFVLSPNVRRSGQLQERLAAARRNIQHELRLFRQKHSERGIVQDGKKTEVRAANPPASSVPSPAGQDLKKKPPEIHRPAAVPKKPVLSPEQQYRQVLRQEMDRIRVQLQLAEMREKIKVNHPVWKSHVRMQPFPRQNQWFEQWRTMLKQRIAEAAKVWKTVYNSHQTFSGFYFTIPTRKGDTRMELRTILRDTVVLYHRGMPNIHLKFRQLAPAEWLDFLRFAANRTGLNRELDSYLLLDGWFMMVEKSADVRIREEVLLTRETFFRYLSGEKIPGLEAVKTPVSPEILEKYRTDPAFAPYRAKLKENKNNAERRMNI